MDPVLINVFGIDIRWYSVLILVAILITIIMTIKEAKRFNIPADFTFNLAFWVVIIGIICARLYYCAFNFVVLVFSNALLAIACGLNLS